MNSFREPVERDRIGVVVVHFNRERDAAALCRSLVELHGLPPANVVLVDNGSHGERLVAELGSFGSRITMTHLENVGYGAAVNVGEGLLPATVDYVMVLTHEVVLAPDCLPVLSTRLERDPTLGLVGPLLLTPAGLVWSAGGSTRSGPRRLPYNTAKGRTPQELRGSIKVDWLDGAAFMMRRDDFLSLRGIEESFFLYFEDVELGWRVRQAGLSVQCDTRTFAVQAPGGHLDQYLATRNLLWLLRRQREWLSWFVVVTEAVVRILVGPLLKPRGAMKRVTLRGKGLVAGLRPPIWTSRVPGAWPLRRTQVSGGAPDVPAPSSGERTL
jgi:N-acetylglucosaminyl-diphospho-decaprenol L-rhamnosyltransferase